MSDTAASELVERARFLAAGQDDPHSETIGELCDLIDSLQRENAVLRGALRKHGKHRRGCSVFPRRTRHLAQCSCGLSMALNRGGAG